MGYFLQFTLSGGEQLDKNPLGPSVPRQPHPTWPPSSTAKASAHSSLKATHNVHEIERDSERLSDISQGHRVLGTLVSPSLPACWTGTPGKGWGRFWTKATSKLPLISRYRNEASGGPDGSTTLEDWGLDLWLPNSLEGSLTGSMTSYLPPTANPSWF